jgi:low affinity Fe/Cu permease
MMLELLTFMFSSFWKLVYCTTMFLVVCATLIAMIQGIGPFTIIYNHHDIHEGIPSDDGTPDYE